MKCFVKYSGAAKALRVATLSLALTIILGPMEAWANGNTFWDWTFTGVIASASGTFEVNSSNVIVGISNGTVTGFPGSASNITSLLAPGSFPPGVSAANDNIFNPSSPFLSTNGVSFNTNIPLNLYFSGTIWEMYDGGFVQQGVFAASALSN